jgi:hypothetical protein
VRRGPLILMFLAVLLSGCSGGGDAAEPAEPRPEVPGANTTPDEPAALDNAVRKAIRSNAQLSDYVLRRNKVPRSAPDSTRGPALAALRESASERRRERVRVRTARGDFDILSVRLDPSYRRAVAVVRQRGRVRPYREGHRLGRAIKVDEKVRIELRRLGDSERFVVWKVVSAK